MKSSTQQGRQKRATSNNGQDSGSLSAGAAKRVTIDHSIRIPPEKWDTLKLLSMLRERSGIDPYSQNGIILEGLELVLEKERKWIQEELQKLVKE